MLQSKYVVIFHNQGRFLALNRSQSGEEETGVKCEAERRAFQEGGMVRAKTTWLLVKKQIEKLIPFFFVLGGGSHRGCWVYSFALAAE